MASPKVSEGGIVTSGAFLAAFLLLGPGPAVYGQQYTLGEALNVTNLQWTAVPSGDTWFVQTTNTHDGVAAVQYGPTAAPYIAKLRTLVVGPGSLTFWFRFASDPPSGAFLDIAQNRPGGFANHTFIVSGTNWSWANIRMGAGIWSIQWGCTVPPSPALETIFLDEIQFTPEVHISSLSISNGQARVDFSAPANLTASFKLFSAPRLDGIWTNHPDAVLSTNMAGDLFNFTAPIDGGFDQFYRVQSSVWP